MRPTTNRGDIGLTECLIVILVIVVILALVGRL